jgi:hypothetical protein
VSPPNWHELRRRDYAGHRSRSCSPSLFLNPQAIESLHPEGDYASSIGYRSAFIANRMVVARLSVGQQFIAVQQSVLSAEH